MIEISRPELFGVERVYTTIEETKGWRYHDFEKILVHLLDGKLRIALINKNDMNRNVLELKQNESIFINSETYYAWSFIETGRLLILSNFEKEESDRDEKIYPKNHFGEEYV